MVWGKYNTVCSAAYCLRIYVGAVPPDKEFGGFLTEYYKNRGSFRFN